MSDLDKRKILLIDYYGMCDSEGMPIGHSAKVLNEYKNLICGEYLVSAAVSPCLIQYASSDFDRVFELKYNIQADGRKKMTERVADKLKILFNISQALKIKGYDLIWFYRTDFFLFLYFFIHMRKDNRYIVGLVYQEEFLNGFLGKIIKKIYIKGAKKFNGIIYTQKDMAKFHNNTLYMPDYYYDEEKYHKYSTTVKKDMVVCLGTMNPYKKLEELVEAFNKNGVKLIIKGYFFEKERFNRLIKMKNENVVIEDVMLPEDEYYKILSEAKYSVLPYDMEQYNCRTSGVLQESIFFKTIPIAPVELLEQNGIQGIGYEKISVLGEKWSELSAVKIANNDIIGYNKKNIQKNLLEFLYYEV